MKYSLLALLLTVPAWSNPYFRLLDVSHPQPIVGALLDPKDLNNSAAATLLPLVTHSPTDGCLIPQVCEDWTPLAVGGSMNAGKFTLDVGPVFNVLPWVQGAALALTPSSWTGLKSIFYSNPVSPVTFSAGPVWEYEQLTNKGYVKVFSGLALHF